MNLIFLVNQMIQFSRMNPKVPARKWELVHKQFIPIIINERDFCRSLTKPHTAFLSPLHQGHKFLCHSPLNTHIIITIIKCHHDHKGTRTHTVPTLWIMVYLAERDNVRSQQWQEYRKVKNKHRKGVTKATLFHLTPPFFLHVLRGFMD